MAHKHKIIAREEEEMAINWKFFLEAGVGWGKFPYCSEIPFHVPENRLEGFLETNHVGGNLFPALAISLWPLVDGDMCLSFCQTTNRKSTGKDCQSSSRENLHVSNEAIIDFLLWQTLWLSSVFIADFARPFYSLNKLPSRKGTEVCDLVKYRTVWKSSGDKLLFLMSFNLFFSQPSSTATGRELQVFHREIMSIYFNLPRLRPVFRKKSLSHFTEKGIETKKRKVFLRWETEQIAAKWIL